MNEKQEEKKPDKQTPDQECENCQKKCTGIRKEICTEILKYFS